jgi:N-acetylglucosamine kinase-like BadF-type ATPase
MALRAASHSADGRGPQTAILPALLRHWQLNQPADLITYLYGAADPRTQLSDVGPIVVALANDGDSVAQTIVLRAAQELAKMVRAVGDTLQMASPLPLAVAGSMIVQSAILQQRLVQCLADTDCIVQLTVVPDPTVGAVRLAHRIAQGESQLTSEWT